MTERTRSERQSQNRLVARFTRPRADGGLGYAHLGDWQQRQPNRAIEPDLLAANLSNRGYKPAAISAALLKLQTAADVTGTTLYQASLRTYQLLRYGVPVQIAAGAPHETVHLIDWEQPDRNQFALAEEVTLRGDRTRRPDVVIYLNGIAVAVIELKRGSVEVAEGVRQLCSNQEPGFHEWFFSTVQVLLAGNDAQGLRVGTTCSSENYFVDWKAGAPDADIDSAGALLDGPMAELCEPARLLDVMRNFVLFDAGRKKVPRPHQYAGIKAAQARIRQREGGVIWHTQGSGKSILMVLLAKWLLEHDPDARVLIVTDRDELDKQIEGVMRNAGVVGPEAPSIRITSRSDLTQKLLTPNPRLMCALIHKFPLSYEGNPTNITREPPNSDERFKFDTYTKLVLKPGQTTKQYEDEAKRQFIEEPANMKLLIVVSKLLTGFDAPSCTYIYLDNEMRDHTLFQAICRTNRLDGDDKPYGHIVDYKELFESVQNSIAVYTSDELEVDTADGSDGNVTVKNWLVEGKQQLDAAREALRYLCEPVPEPRELEQFLGTFCGADFTATEPLRISFYKAVMVFLRAYAELANHLEQAGYSDAVAETLAHEAQFYAETRAGVKRHCGEELDIKPFEADMRHLINTYIQADAATDLGHLNDLSLVQLIIETGIHDAIAKKLNAKGKLSNKAVAEGIVNNVRSTIIREQLTDPRFYSEMSKLLDDLIAQRAAETLTYEAFLIKAEELVRRLATKAPTAGVPMVLHGKPEATVLFNNLPTLLAAPPKVATGVAEPSPPYIDEWAQLALRIDAAMREKAPAGWKGDAAREAQVLNALFPLMGRDRTATAALFEIIKHQPGY